MMQINVLSVGLLVVCAGGGVALTMVLGSPVWAVAGAALGLVAAQSPRVAQQWERAIVLRLGRFVGLRGPGLFWIVPLVETVARRIDQRVITTAFAAEQTLTSDTVPVLAIYRTVPMEQALKEFPPASESERAAVERALASGRAMLSRWQRDLLAGVPTARIVELPGANLFMFLTNEADIIREVRAFATTLE